MGFTGTQHVFWTRICAIVLIFHAVSLGTYAAELFPYDSHTEILEYENDQDHCFNLAIPLVVSRQQHNVICAGVNGFISFTKDALDDYQDIQPFPAPDHPILAGIWSDIDNYMYDGTGSHILQTSVTTPSDKQLYTETIKTIDEDFQTDWAFIVTWEDVWEAFDYYDSMVEQNSFQIALVADRTRGKTYSIFNYHKVEWNYSPHAAGYNYGDGMTMITLPGVDDDNFVAEVLQKSNVGVPGRYVIRVDGTPDITCKQGWRLYGKYRCYRIYKGRRSFTFTDASKYCRSMGGELATDILGRSQRRFIRRQIRFSAHFWVGIHDMDGDRLYKDMNGNTVTSGNAFKRGVPTRANRCVSFKRGKLFPKDCSKRQRLICQMDSTNE